ncbi:MAG: hypothetical protein H7099_03365, partial [Gemmatimonadaceae bacterium]|nr:hypothetical protein [Gemmatimonadaceae bacterium]
MSPARKAKKKSTPKSTPKSAKKAAKKSAKKSAKKAVTKVAPKVAKKATTKATTKATKKAAAKRPAPKKSAAVVQAQRAVLHEAQLKKKRAAMKAERRSRATQRLLHVAEFMGTTDIGALTAAMHEAIARTSDARLAAAPEASRRAGRVMAQATSNVNRWVPIGPSVVRLGQADNHPRVTGRVRDIAIDSTGLRAYAATGKAGVWYTEDAGHSWRPVGGWVTRPGRLGGASSDLSCGCLLVEFGATAAADYVMVGTGELVAPSVTGVNSPAHIDFGGRGVLAGLGPVTKPDTDVPYEAEMGIALLENLGIYRLVRDPGQVAPGTLSADGNRVLAAATNGLYLGTRGTVAGISSWTWTRVVGLDGFTMIGNSAMSDVAWIPVAGAANGRIIVVEHGGDVAWSDDAGATWTAVGQLNFSVDNITLAGRCSISALVGDHIYVLGSTTLATPINGRRDEPFVWRIPTVNRTVANGGPGTAVKVRGIPSLLWGTQREWDQAIFAERVGTADRIWVAGSAIIPYAGADYSAQVYCFDVIETGTGAPRMGPAAGVSRMAAAPTGEGANISGLIGNGIHADVHAVRVVTLADGSRHVWVACDGGVYVSERGGRVNTFQSRGTGLAAIEAGFMAHHPTSSHYCALGSQDNGVQVRTGDTMWEMTMAGDGGGVMFHPTASQFLISQYVRGTWFSRPPAKFRDPISRTGGGAVNTNDRESKLASFYSGCDAIQLTANTGRIAIGTNRVWVSDDLSATTNSTWKVIPATTGAAVAATDPRPGGGDGAPTRTRGVPTPALGPVTQIRWATTRQLYVVYRRGIVRHDDDGTGRWTTTMILVPAQAGAPDTTAIRCTDLAPVPGTNDFYVTTLGDAITVVDTETDTCWYFHNGAFEKTGLRKQLDPPAPPPARGPLDPAHAVCLDPDNPAVIFVGTIGGMWRGERTVVGPTTTHTWSPFMNGLPVTCVSDIRIWKDPSPAPLAGAPKLLRAATQSRGLWEVNLAAPSEPQRTYLRVHSRDDRRMPVSPLVDPSVAPTAPPLKVYASPDIVVRPARRAAAATAVPFPLAANKSLGPSHSGSYHLWTFQTAFRWRFPAIRADGRWTDQLADLIALFRATTAGLTTGNVINKATWDAVVGGTRLDANRVVTATATDGFAVYETPWQTAAAAIVTATEVDLFELVQPARVQNSIWNVYKEPSVVDVLLHHRDTRPMAANGGYVALFWRELPTDVALLAEVASTFAPLHAWTGGALPVIPNWTTSGVQRLPVAIDAFMPRAVSTNVDLSAIGAGNHVLFLAVCGGSAEPAPPAPVGLPAAVHRLLNAMSWVIWAVFAVDLIARVWLAERRWHYLSTHPIDVVMVLLPALRPLRVLR